MATVFEPVHALALSSLCESSLLHSQHRHTHVIIVRNRQPIALVAMVRVVTLCTVATVLAPSFVTVARRVVIWVTPWLSVTR